ncbi:CHAT domain-containing protein, partial [Kamptonema animale CS-326]|uniref:CHAT domain-containing protein n=1 Tax=Kamptonema animale TaxID=92934 RepID=UPI00232C426C
PIPTPPPTPTPIFIPTPIPPTPPIPISPAPLPPTSPEIPIANPSVILPPTQNPVSISLDLQKPSTALQPNLIELGNNLRNLTSENATEAVFNSTFRANIDLSFNSGNIIQALGLIEKSFTQEFGEYLGRNLTVGFSSLNDIQNSLKIIEQQTGTKPSLIYMFSRPEQLELVLVTSSGSIVHKAVPEAKRDELLKVITEFRNDITNPRFRNSTIYRASAQLLYKWMVTPLEPTLQERGIDTIAFTMDKGLRGIPIAALHDGQKFLMEKYNLSLIPSINLTDTRYVDVKNSPVLAMGASRFINLNPLPAVPLEIATIMSEWPGVGFLNEGFTLENFRRQRETQPFGIIHLATHGEFQPGAPSNSFIQLWDSRLQLDQLQQLRLNNPAVELLVLSACKTAVGDGDAELGFGGLAVQAGVKTALASLWYVSDEGTLGLMTEFYGQLKSAPIKAAALRQAQMAMLRGEVRLQGGQLRISNGATVDLPEPLLKLGDRNLSHPFYWSAFVMIGSPW